MWATCPLEASVGATFSCFVFFSGYTTSQSRRRWRRALPKRTRDCRWNKVIRSPHQTLDGAPINLVTKIPRVFLVDAIH